MNPTIPSPTIPQQDPGYFMQPSEPPVDPATKHRKAIIKGAIILCIVLVVLTIGLVAFTRLKKESPPAAQSSVSAQEVSDKFFQYLAENKTQEAYDLYSSDQKPTSTDFNQFVTRFTTIVDFSQCQTAQDNSETEIIYNCRSKNSSSSISFKVILVKDQDSYKITSCRLVGSS